VDYFHSKQTNLIVEANVTTAGMYVNQGEATFQGTELEGKYYLKKAFFVMGSASYQANEDGNGNRNITPVPNFAAKAGISYESANGLTAALFDVHEGPLHGYSQATNPKPGVYDMLNMHLRYDLSRHLHAHGPGLALVVHADNLTNKAVWLPDWKDAPGDSIFFNRGRTVYAGLEVSFKAE
jgi:outer membrane receptor protein involved in Fe transport